ncbi:hypothetical protein, partial [Bradyrhizobium sp. AUGA SZCCT0283]|uniref:hypothetical protein n=1 Tax=Bradyrhizobium sp. AUGA SZCCT0283 TaxID=2807671 RepID=UPI001BA7C308
PPFVTPAAAHSHPDCRGIPIQIVALQACIDRNDSGGLRRVIGQILDNQYPTSANAAADGCRPLALKIAVRQRRKRGKTMRAGVGTNLQSDRSLGPALICSASVPSRIRLSI